MDSTVLDYRTCFSTDPGKRVLAHILLDAGYFDSDLKTEGEIAVHNFVNKIIKNLGICGTPQSAVDFVSKMFEINVTD